MAASEPSAPILRVLIFMPGGGLPPPVTGQTYLAALGSLA